MGKRGDGKGSGSWGFGQTTGFARAGKERNPASAAIGIQQRLGGFEVFRISKEIPSFTIAILPVDFTGSAKIGGGIIHAPRQPALNRQNRIDRPALENLSWRLHAGDGVRQGVCKAMPDIKPAWTVEISRSVGIDWIEKTPVVRRHSQSVSERVTKNERNSMRGSLRH